MAIGSLTPITRWQILQDGEPVPGALLYTYLSGSSTPQAVYTTSAINVARTNPVEAGADGVFPIMYLAPVAYRFTLTDADGNVIYPAQDNIYDFAEVQLATAGASTGSALVGFLQSGSGAVARTAQAKMRERVNVTDFGAVGDGVADDTAAFNAALASLSSDGGTIVISPGTYKLTSTWDLTSKTNVWVQGSGATCTKLVTTVTTTAGINASTTATRFTKLCDFALYQSALVIPAVARAGNYGIRNTGGVGYQLHLDHVDIRFFAAAGVFIEGATGPTSVEDCSIQSIAGYGVQIKTLGGDVPQDVSLIRGNIQQCFGGVNINAGFGWSIQDTDIELGATATFPALYVQGASYGGTCTDATFSLDAIPTPAACVCFDAGPQGIVIIGGLNYVTISGGGAVDNLLFKDSGPAHITVIGGNYTQSGSGGTTGYYANFTGGTNCAFIHPILTATFQAGKAIVNDAAANFVTAIGIATASLAEGDNNGASFPKVHTTMLALEDGVTAPSTIAGLAQIYVDTADGDLKVKFGDGTTKVISADT